MKTVRFETDYFLNGQVLYAAGVDHPADGHNEQLITDGVAGQVTDDGVAGQVTDDGAGAPLVQASAPPAADPQA